MKNEQLLIDLSDEQCEKVVGGVGAGPFPGAGSAGWFGGPPGSGHGLFGADQGFGPVSNEHSAVDVTVPVKS